MKILELPKFKPVKCKGCGCVYEYTKKDKIELDYGDLCIPIVSKCVGAILACPICGLKNKLEKEDCLIKETEE